MRHEELHKALHKSPFEPFRIQITNGESWVIRHPVFAGLTRTSVLVFLSSRDDDVPDTFNQYDLLHVVGIEPTKRARSNGRGTQRKKKK